MTTGKLRDGVVRRGSTYSYVIRMTDPVTGVSRPRWVGGFATEAAAKGARDRARLDARRGDYVDRNQVSVQDYLREWLAAHALEIKPKTVEDYRSLIERYVIPRIGRMRLQAVRPATISTLYATLLREGGHDGGPLSPRTVSYVHSVLRKALDDAVLTEQVLVSNPVARAKRPRTEAPQLRHEIWDAEQLNRFLNLLADDRLLPFFRVAAFTGARRGELLHLRWRDLSLDGSDPHLVINGSTTIVRGHRVDGTTKTGRSRRVSLDQGTVQVLHDHRERQLWEAERLGPAWPGGDQLFRMESGKPLRVDRPGEVMRAAIASGNMLPIRLHDLRHVHATLLLTAGVPVHVVAARLGHADPAMTLRVYAHVLTDQAAGVAETFAALIAEKAAG